MNWNREKKERLEKKIHLMLKAGVQVRELKSDVEDISLLKTSNYNKSRVPRWDAGTRHEPSSIEGRNYPNVLLRLLLLLSLST